MDTTWMLYGANGYTGRLIAHLAAARGQRPVLAGRSAAPVAALAAELGLEHRAFDLADAGAVRAALHGVGAVAHCAGPFSTTAAPMVDACLATGTHYLDITGEIDVFERIHARDAEARAAGTVLLPGAGFDVVPTDCLAALVAAEVPGADRLDLAIMPGRNLSPGTAKTALEGLALGGRARVGGRIVPVPAGWRTLSAGFPSGPRTVTSIPWGDVSTAYHSTGVPGVTTYTVLPGGAAVRGLQALAGPLLRRPAVRRAAGRVIDRLVPGADAARRAGARAEVWARATAPSGASATAALTCPDPYDLTADSVVRAVARLLADEVKPGAHTPSTAFGPRYVADLDGVVLTGPARTA
ncbi:saccharopine dehydrogenase family protein [Streptomyces sp. NPDC001380]|uniref:saccharopine dehydrogenase family protein n=1 Tax=Streptomyces sp. NPDC001380 TaxID=3364566 RepID=UPI0036BD0DD7